MQQPATAYSTFKNICWNHIIWNKTFLVVWFSTAFFIFQQKNISLNSVKLQKIEALNR